MTRDPRIDRQIDEAAPFAKPILVHLRETMHEALPTLEEAIKWGRPFFLLDGKPFAFIAAFKAHAGFGFWRGPETGKERDAAGQYGKLTSLDDLPPTPDLIALIRAAAAKADEPIPPRPRAPKAEIAMPDDVAAALAATPTAQTGYDALSPSCRREYLEWIVAAKRPETRAGRIAKTVDQLSQGKKLNWKYESC